MKENKLVDLSKLFLTFIFAFAVFAFGAICASAETEEYLYYSVSNGATTITDCNTSASGDLVIPDTLGGYPVTSIGDNAFLGCKGLTSVIIPDGVTSIGYMAFCDCTGLTSVTIPDGVTIIGGFAFYRCTGLTSVTIPDSATSIGSSAFSGCTGLTSVTIPGSVTSIGSDAFLVCDGLTKVEITDIAAWCDIEFEDVYSNPLYYAKNLYLNGTKVTNLIIPDGVTSIGSWAFSGCTGLTSVTIPGSVTSIGGSAFLGCKGLTSVTIPGSVTSIGSWAFRGCTGLISVMIPDSVTSIGDNAFYGCTGLISVMIPDSVTSIGDYTFYGCTGLISVTIPDNVTSIGDNAFYGCTGLISVMIPDSVTSIGDNAFYGCTGLTSVTIPDSVTSIGSDAFYGCTGLTSVTIPDGVASIGGYTFYRCTGLISVTIPDSVTSIGSFAFYECTGLTKVEITDIAAWCDIEFNNAYSNPLYYAKNLYLNGTKVTNLIIPDGATSIGGCTFYGCTGLTSVTIPDSVISIGGSAFLGCKGLTSVTIPDSVTSIGGSAFYGCTGLTSVTVGNGITLLPENVFRECSELKYVCLSAELLYIRNDAFNGCANIETVFFAGTEEQWENILFYNRNENLTNAKVIYNVTKKTYSFVTNCDISLSDMTDYAIFTSPTVKNDGATLQGWYDNAELAGEPVSFPYYGDATTLYAEWTDRTGTSFDDAIIVKANREYSVSTTTSGQLVYFEFTPSESKEYRFYSTGSKDTYGYLYNSNKSQLKSNDDDGEGNNFYIAYTLTAGETYYIAAKAYSEAGTFTFVVEKPVDYCINSITLSDESGNKLDSIVQGSFLVTVSFTNVSSSEDTVIVLAQYSANNEFSGLMYVKTKDVPVDSTIELMLPVDNTNGNIIKLKAFCWESLSSPAPMGESISFPADV